MAAHAQAESPRECCGLLIGIAGHVVEARRAPNLSGDPNRFLLDPQAHVEFRLNDHVLNVPALPAATAGPISVIFEDWR